jgi:MazG family protein
VFQQWEKLKAGEQAARGDSRRVLSGVPLAMPALLRAHEIGTRVAAVGFDWPRAADILDKIDEEVRELREAAAEGPARLRDELGDVLFSIANLARQLDVDAEAALREANDKFSRRFDAVEAALEARGRSVHEATLEEMEAAWQAVKRLSTKHSP